MWRSVHGTSCARSHIHEFFTVRTDDSITCNFYEGVFQAFVTTIPCTKDDRSTSFIRVLVVEDYAPFRQFVCSTLGKRSELQIVGEASDGLEAFQKAEELRPHLIVLDVGLPTLNGIDAARRIRKLSPETKILFVTQETSGDVVQEALRVGALGYVVKARAGSELLAAVEAVCQGRQFVSSGVVGFVLTEAASSRRVLTQT